MLTVIAEKTYEKTYSVNFGGADKNNIIRNAVSKLIENWKNGNISESRKNWESLYEMILRLHPGTDWIETLKKHLKNEKERKIISDIMLEFGTDPKGYKLLAQNDKIKSTEKEKKEEKTPEWVYSDKEWKIIRKGEVRALAIPQKDDASIDKLAKIIGLDASESPKWLKTENGKQVNKIEKGKTVL